MALLETDEVVHALWGNASATLSLERDLFGIPNRKMVGFTLETDTRKKIDGYALAFDTPPLPSRSRIFRLLAAEDVHVGVIVARLTTEHVLFVVIKIGKNNIAEIGRKTYRLS